MFNVEKHKQEQCEYWQAIGKDKILKEPQNYSLRYAFTYLQFTQDELLSLRHHVARPNDMTLYTMIQYQTSLTYSYLYKHWLHEINADDYADWTDVDKYVIHK